VVKIIVTNSGVTKQMIVVKDRKEEFIVAVEIMVDVHTIALGLAGMLFVVADMVTG